MGFFYIEYPTLVDDEPKLAAKPADDKGAAAGATPPAAGAAPPAAGAAPPAPKVGFLIQKIMMTESQFEQAPAPAPDAKGAAAKPADAKAGDAKADEAKGKPEVFEKPPKKKLLLFNNKDKLVLPMYCKSKLDPKEIFGISTHSQDYVNAWREASGNKDASSEELPLLDPPAFAKFYSKVTEDMIMDVDMLPSKDAEGKANDLAATINFQNSNLKKVSWFQFWVFLCSAGVMPDKQEYMRNTPVSDDIFMKKLNKQLKATPKPAAATPAPAGTPPKRKIVRKKFYRMRGRTVVRHPYYKI